MPKRYAPASPLGKPGSLAIAEPPAPPNLGEGLAGLKLPKLKGPGKGANLGKALAQAPAVRERAERVRARERAQAQAQARPKPSTLEAVASTTGALADRAEKTRKFHQERAKQEAPKQEAPKQEAPKAEPKQEPPKQGRPMGAPGPETPGKQPMQPARAPDTGTKQRAQPVPQKAPPTPVKLQPKGTLGQAGTATEKANRRVVLHGRIRPRKERVPGSLGVGEAAKAPPAHMPTPEFDAHRVRAIHKQLIAQQPIAPDDRAYFARHAQRYGELLDAHGLATPKVARLSMSQEEKVAAQQALAEHDRKVEAFITGLPRHSEAPSEAAKAPPEPATPQAEPLQEPQRIPNKLPTGGVEGQTLSDYVRSKPTGHDAETGLGKVIGTGPRTPQTEEGSIVAKPVETPKGLPTPQRAPVTPRKEAGTREDNAGEGLLRAAARADTRGDIRLRDSLLRRFRHRVREEHTEKRTESNDFLMERLRKIQGQGQGQQPKEGTGT